MTHEELLLFGERLRNRRNLLSFTQEYVAEKIGISLRFYQMIERGEKIPRLETFVNITNALDTTSDEILEGVLNKGYEIRMSEYIKKIEGLPKEEQNQIYDVLDVMLKYGHKRR